MRPSGDAQFPQSGCGPGRPARVAAPVALILRSPRNSPVATGGPPFLLGVQSLVEQHFEIRLVPQYLLRGEGSGSREVILRSRIVIVGDAPAWLARLRASRATVPLPSLPAVLACSRRSAIRF